MHYAPRSVLAIYSGGMDSFTLVNDLHRKEALAACLSFNYGQRHSKELQYASRVCAQLDIPHKVVDITSLQDVLAGSALTSPEVAVPEGHYAEDSMKLTVVPNRNMILLSIAVGYAISQGLTTVAYGAHSGDHTIYPDCRPGFVHAMAALASIANWEPIMISAPYLYLNKASILRIGHDLGLDYAQSWTCYKGGEFACGKCGSCQERLEAFDAIGKRDPLQYEEA